ncbi:MAG: hypothetical protein FWD77_06740 [Betaproteobacteria bacterium]|nr:hypothetical protein [Betaproteobacteria bacterium]
MTEKSALHRHEYLDARSLAMHRLIAGKTHANPELFDRVLPTIQRWKTMVSKRTLPHLEAWEELVKQGMEPCLIFATEDSERARELRQSAPFSAILTTEERNAFMAAWRRDYGKRAA